MRNTRGRGFDSHRTWLTPVQKMVILVVKKYISNFLDYKTQVSIAHGLIDHMGRDDQIGKWKVSTCYSNAERDIQLKKIFANLETNLVF